MPRRNEYTSVAFCYFLQTLSSRKRNPREEDKPSGSLQKSALGLPPDGVLRVKGLCVCESVRASVSVSVSVYVSQYFPESYECGSKGES